MKIWHQLVVCERRKMHRLSTWVSCSHIFSFCIFSFQESYEESHNQWPYIAVATHGMVTLRRLFLIHSLTPRPISTCSTETWSETRFPGSGRKRKGWIGAWEGVTRGTWGRQGHEGKEDEARDGTSCTLHFPQISMFFYTSKLLPTCRQPIRYTVKYRHTVNISLK